MATDPLSGIPAEVQEFFASAAKSRNEALGIFPLNEEESRCYTFALRQTTIGENLGLIALDDANNSNPYCYIATGLARGMILYFSHDPEPELRFSSLAAFRDALMVCAANGQHLDDLKPTPLSPLDSQDELEAHLVELIDRSGDDAKFLVCLFLPLLEPSRLTVLERLAVHTDFLLREAVSTYIQRHPLPAHLPLAALLAVDARSQVARPAKAAMHLLRARRA